MIAILLAILIFFLFLEFNRLLSRRSWKKKVKE